MKKRHKSVAVFDAGATAVEATDLKALIHESSVFFDKLVNLIPPRFYLPSEDSKPWFQGLSKAKKASFKRQSRENIKLARRNRLDPEKKIAQSSTLDLLKESIEKQKIVELSSGNTDDSDKDKPGEDDVNENADDRSVTYEELRQRLRRKIEALRGNRGAGERSERKGSGKDGDLVNSEGKKRKRNSDGGGHSEKTGNEANPENVLSEVEFGKVKIGDDDKQGKKKKKKMSKAKELERLKRLEEVKKENPKVAEKQSWKAAADRAMGVKVHDNPRLLKESMKREKKRKEKSTEKWKERVESREKSKGERQQKRRENISGRIHEKKMRKIAKREKKLMRPGFEGRKQEFITKD
ncbi:PREDICTED: ribosomal RNA-processing protein 14-C-like [Ipomoea nil]|uniref:ribosomal RNA-processing protein 14-C-like n=1 Tax=Ipomoea nil TaxID=35883 RepID=UPI000900A01F|nr:PREDICTED: ribosomal RNA-processing protein 14-C-like [Ipomoea nil]XP_019151527.1 PREDICTED: ribosomal RNA-processing protein 14-C-like [Ipomoea nil]XP_019151535.1 PREDICTED: ribosomal RNA-processing protein 14-C-like [Ipomoea nil]